MATIPCFSFPAGTSSSLDFFNRKISITFGRNLHLSLLPGSENSRRIIVAFKNKYEPFQLAFFYPLKRLFTILNSDESVMSRLFSLCIRCVFKYIS